MYLQGTRDQNRFDRLLDASSTIAVASTAQLVLPERKSTAFLYIQNISDTVMFLEFGSARAHATITNGVVTAVTVDNAGFGFTRPPTVQFLGGGNSGNGGILGCGQWGYPSPGDAAYTIGRLADLSGQRPAKAHAVLTSGAVSSIAIEDGGAGYNQAPYVLITDDIFDPFGCAIPSLTSGLMLVSAGIREFHGVMCPTDPIAIFCETAAAAFTCKWAP